MRLIPADFERRIALPGVSEPVQRPVDIDRSVTGFAQLRSFRVYCFDAGTAIDGHAEEDEVFLILLSGTIRLKLGATEGETSTALPVALRAPKRSAREGVSCAVYLPPGGAYFLEATSDAVVAYARATPSFSGAMPKVFTAPPIQGHAAIESVFADQNYAERLQVRLYSLRTEAEDVAFSPGEDAGGDFEALLQVYSAQERALLHVGSAGQGDFSKLASFDSVAFRSAERPRVHLVSGVDAFLLLVLAK
ncbi:MAG: 5-deoxy-glucuronate isomerase [Rhodospirillales bacterium]|nr:5-deoxy-glucuronate isomerase [Acetobacter sp.]